MPSDFSSPCAMSMPASRSFFRSAPSGSPRTPAKAMSSSSSSLPSRHFARMASAMLFGRPPGFPEVPFTNVPFAVRFTGFAVVRFLAMGRSPKRESRLGLPGGFVGQTNYSVATLYISRRWPVNRGGLSNLCRRLHGGYEPPDGHSGSYSLNSS